ncbi:hypothetical protein LC586_35115 [Nostoc sp. CHAB 5714]|uniref:Uncharacterized protein n=1 Tax=Nostoc favosum CHAB5714 TaxID=2780399 RepID=A0ABS8IJU1_9NOSO|nr:hypothetical protein [Nostoc favosum CHAB5714]
MPITRRRSPLHHNRSTLDARCAWAFLCGEAMLALLTSCRYRDAIAFSGCQSARFRQ